jgi:hypothetical protein
MRFAVLIILKDSIVWYELIAQLKVSINMLAYKGNPF